MIFHRVLWSRCFRTSIVKVRLHKMCDMLSVSTCNVTIWARAVECLRSDTETVNW